ncbi:hypothetical protein ACFSRY_14975 [Pontibacter locisalis]|uniref:Pectate lyase superfamily protein n=1 Tax=Pontibacter locisalis TaxID=1719035 RepID=A0ABW5INE2_9BACT
MVKVLASFIIVISLFFINKYYHREGLLAHHISSLHQSYLIKQSDTGRLMYGFYANEGESDKINRIPDFSYAGYMGGGVRIPNVPVKLVLEPKPGDNKKQIQDAIDRVSSMSIDNSGFRGKILLKAGNYHINGSLRIKTNGVILAGEGHDEKGTVLIATQESKHTFIYLGNASNKSKKIEDTATRITSDYVATGSNSFTVETALKYEVGDTIVIQKTPNEDWIIRLGMSQYGWTPEAYQVLHERIISGIKGNQVTINIPIVDPIKAKDGGGTIYKFISNRATKQSGIENIRLVSSYMHDEDEEHGWNGIKLQMAENCWVRNVTVLYFGFSAVTVDKNSAFNTIEDCAMLDPMAKTEGKRKYSFNMGLGSFNLFQRCYTRGGRHDFVTGARVSGPNVFLDCYADSAKSDIGPHQRWATGTLFDNVQGQNLRVRNRSRRGSKTRHGWAGAQTMFWNCVSTSSMGMTVENPPGSINWIVGGQAAQVIGNGYIELLGKQVLPRSLYLAQLQNRLGLEAVINVTTPMQRSGTIYSNLIR